MKLSLHQASLFGAALHQFPAVRLKANVVKKMADNLIAINSAFPDMGKEISEAYERLGKPQETEPAFKTFIQEKVTIEKETFFDVELKTIRYEELNIGDGQYHNQLPPNAVVALSPMISDFQEGQ